LSEAAGPSPYQLFAEGGGRQPARPERLDGSSGRFAGRIIVRDRNSGGGADVVDGEMKTPDVETTMYSKSDLQFTDRPPAPPRLAGERRSSDHPRRNTVYHGRNTITVIQYSASAGHRSATHTHTHTHQRCKHGHFCKTSLPRPRPYTSRPSSKGEIIAYLDTSYLARQYSLY